MKKSERTLDWLFVWPSPHSRQTALNSTELTLLFDGEHPSWPAQMVGQEKCASFTPKPPTHDTVLDLSVTIMIEGFGTTVGEKSWVKSNLLLMMGSWLLSRYVLTRDTGGEVLVRNGMESFSWELFGPEIWSDYGSIVERNSYQWIVIQIRLL